MSDPVEAFDQFISKIELSESAVSRIESAFGALRSYLAEKYSIPTHAIFVQGSCANGTAIRPPHGGDYDLDIVAIIDRGEQSSNEALSQLKGILDQSSRYSGKTELRKPCVRIAYADDEIGGFHIDIVPARTSHEDLAPLQSPRKDEDWHETAPQEFTQWCHDQGLGFRRTVMALKRWRDDQQDVRKAVKSIVLQVLIADCISPSRSDAQRLVETLRALSDRLALVQGVPVVLNPVLPSENLAERWTQESFRDFRKNVNEAADLAERAWDAADLETAMLAWHELLGSDFPISTPVSAGLTLGDATHARSIDDEGWYEDLDDNIELTVDATTISKNGRRVFRRHYQLPPVNILPSGIKIKFEAQATGAPTGARIWWQVVNTGSHAAQENGLRGNFLKAKSFDNGISAREDIHWESTSYTGSHWVEAFMVAGSTVVARSGPVFVHIVNPRTWRKFGR